MPPDDIEQPEQPTHAPGEATGEYGSQTKELKDIDEEFRALSAEITVCHHNFLNLMRTTTIINRTTFFILTPEQDDDLFEELAQINELLGQARTMFNAFVTIENSIPNFPVLFGFLYNIHEMLDDHGKTVFFQVHLRDDMKCLYPKAPIERKIKMFGSMLGGTRGTSVGIGKFVLYTPLLGGAGDGRGGGTEYNSGYSSAYRNGRSRLGVPETQEEPHTEQNMGM